MQKVLEDSLKICTGRYVHICIYMYNDYAFYIGMRAFVFSYLYDYMLWICMYMSICIHTKASSLLLWSLREFLFTNFLLGQTLLQGLNLSDIGSRGGGRGSLHSCGLSEFFPVRGPPPPPLSRPPPPQGCSRTCALLCMRRLLLRFLASATRSLRSWVTCIIMHTSFQYGHVRLGAVGCPVESSVLLRAPGFCEGTSFRLPCSQADVYICFHVFIYLS